MPRHGSSDPDAKDAPPPDQQTFDLPGSTVLPCDDPFYSEFSSHLKILPNGNVLVTESNAGRIFEVTREGEIVWEFWNPERLIEDGSEYVASVADAERIPREVVDFLGDPGR